MLTFWFVLKNQFEIFDSNDCYSFRLYWEHIAPDDHDGNTMLGCDKERRKQRSRKGSSMHMTRTIVLFTFPDKGLTLFLVYTNIFLFQTDWRSCCEKKVREHKSTVMSTLSCNSHMFSSFHLPIPVRLPSVYTPVRHHQSLLKIYCALLRLLRSTYIVSYKSFLSANKKHDLCWPWDFQLALAEICIYGRT